MRCMICSSEKPGLARIAWVRQVHDNGRSAVFFVREFGGADQDADIEVDVATRDVHYCRLYERAIDGATCEQSVNYPVAATFERRSAVDQFVAWRQEHEFGHATRSFGVPTGEVK